MRKQKKGSKWLLIVEGNEDLKSYKKYLGKSGVDRDDFAVVPASGKDRVCDAAQWEHNEELWTTLRHNLAGRDFAGIILLVDSDTNSASAFDKYGRSQNLKYVNPPPEKTQKENFWQLDELEGIKLFPILGIAVPMGSAGCLETELLVAYGFPIEGQPEYASLVEIIKKASNEWKVPKLGNGNDWWEENTKAKMDKFIYHSLKGGFSAVDQKTPDPPQEPNVIRHIKAAMASCEPKK